MPIPSLKIMKNTINAASTNSFTAIESFDSPCGRGKTITVHTLTRQFSHERIWRYTSTSFKTFKDGFDAPVMKREIWQTDTVSDMMFRWQQSEHCQCAKADNWHSA